MTTSSPRANLALVVTIAAALLLFWFVRSSYSDGLQWLPQFVVTLVGLVGASWFVGHRLDLLSKDIDQRQSAADAQLAATERGNFNGAIKEAVTMLSHESSLSASLAGQRWLYTIASVGPTEANLVQALLCNHIAASPATADFQTKSRQAALRLLFRPTENDRFVDCADIPDLGATRWRNLDFSGLDARGANFAEGDFTGAAILGARFDDADLCDTQWSSAVGGDSRTLMCGATFHGARGSSCTFTNVDFAGAKLANNGHRTVYRACTFERCSFQASDWTGATFEHCTFKQCDFSDAIWAGVTLDVPIFELCPGVTFDQCKTLKQLTKPTGLPDELIVRLREMGLTD